MTATLSTPLATGRWRHVPAGTTAAFSVRNFGVRTVTGTVPVADAWVEVDANGRPARVQAILDLRAIGTGHRKRDADLQKPHLLDTANHPTLTFVAAAPEPGPGGWVLAGRLTGRAATDVTLQAAVERAPAGGDVVVHASTTVDRRALGVRAPRFLIGRRLRIEVTATFRPPR